MAGAGTATPTSQIPRKHQVGDRQKEVGEARKWTGGRTSKRKYKMPDSLRPNSMVAGSTKSLAVRFYQLKMGHTHTGKYLHWTRARPIAQCWWCPHPKQPREHLQKGCLRWRKQQRVLWKKVWKETGGVRHQQKNKKLKYIAFFYI